MSKYRFKTLEKLKTGQKGTTMELAVPLPKSPSGKVKLYCPNEECSPRVFLLGDRTQQPVDANKKVKRKPGEKGVTCSYCGFDGDEQEFISEEDRQAAIKEIEWAAVQDTGEILDGIFKKAGFGKKGSLITMEVKKPRNPKPRFYREDLLRNIGCKTCSREYGVYAIGLYCPDCGSTNVGDHFEREAHLIQNQVNLATQNSDEELSYRLLGNAHEDVLTAFETYLKTLFKELAFIKAPENIDQLEKKSQRGNPFQSVDRASELFNEISIDLFNCLTPDEKEKLKVYIGKRHIVGHNLSMVDDKYSSIIDDHENGVTVTIIHDEVLEFVNICSKIITSLEKEFK